MVISVFCADMVDRCNACLLGSLCFNLDMLLRSQERFDLDASTGSEAETARESPGWLPWGLTVVSLK